MVIALLANKKATSVERVCKEGKDVVISLPCSYGRLGTNHAIVSLGIRHQRAKKVIRMTDA